MSLGHVSDNTMTDADYLQYKEEVFTITPVVYSSTGHWLCVVRLNIYIIFTKLPYTRTVKDFNLLSTIN